MQNKPKKEQNKKAKLFEKIIFDNLYYTPTYPPIVIKIINT